jgi:hypothetical protein
MSKKLNGLPNNLIASLFGTARSDAHGFVLRFCDGGYMADWLANGAKKYNLDSAILDIKAGKIIPSQLNIHPLVSNIEDLNIVIANELAAAKLSSDFISEATIEIFFIPNSRSFQARAFVINKDGGLYESDQKSHEALEPYFDVEERMIEINKRLNKLNKKPFWKRLFG